ncbi:MAG: DUF748 domain-containing protein [Planctomycetes bacterium]|nr:DUF748 domain-containing protein [Planctomycetota bacterium]
MNAAPSSAAGPRARSRRWRWILGIVGMLVAGLIVVRLALPGIIRRYVNDVLSRSPDFDGSIEAIDVHLWRGAYSIRGIRIIKTTGRVPVPFFESKELDLHMDWRSLIHGKFRGSMRLDEPRLNFVMGRSRQESQTGVDQPWLSMLNDLFPFQLDRVTVDGGEVHFHTFHTSPKVNVYLSDIAATVENLTNASGSLDPLIATVRATGTAMHSGRFELELALDPVSHRPNFDLATRLLDLDVRKLNDLARAFGGFDFEEGRFDFVIEAATKDGFLNGYAKPLFRDAIVLGPRDLREESPFRAGWEAIVGAVGAILSNQERRQFGTRFTLVGEFDDPQTSTLEVIGNVLRNAFIRAYLPNIEGRATPEFAGEAGLEKKDR